MPDLCFSTACILQILLEGSADLSIALNPNPCSPGLGMSKLSSLLSSEDGKSSAGWLTSAEPSSLSTSKLSPSDFLALSTACRFLMAVVHLPRFPFGVPAEMSGERRFPGTSDMAKIFPFALYTGMSIGVPEEAVLCAQSITMEPVDIIIWFPTGLSTVSGRGSADSAHLVLEACFMAAF